MLATARVVTAAAMNTAATVKSHPSTYSTITNVNTGLILTRRERPAHRNG